MSTIKREKLPWLHALAICCLVGVALPSSAGDVVPDDRLAEEAHQHYHSGAECLNSGNFACASKETSWLESSAFPEIGKVLSGYALFRQKRYDEAINTTGAVYPLMPPKGAGPVTRDLYLTAHELAASTIGEAKYALKQPDAEVLPFLLEGARYRTSDGIVVEDGTLYCISMIYLNQGHLGLSFGFGLERYKKLKTLYDQAPAGSKQKQLEAYLHAEEYRFALLLAALGDMDASGEWLKKAARYKDGDYLKQASETALLKAVLDSTGLGDHSRTKLRQ